MTTPETIYLIPGEYEGENCLVWCDCAAPDSYCDPDDAVSVPDVEYIRALQDAFDIIQADANTEENYASLCRIGDVLVKLMAGQEQGQ